MGMDRKKGVSLVEVVVAMAIIVIISVSALSVALSTSRITDKASLRFQAVNQIEDIVTLAEAAESKADFVEKLKKYSNSVSGESGDQNTDVYTIAFDRKDYNITVEMSESEGSVKITAASSSAGLEESRSFPVAWGAAS